MSDERRRSGLLFGAGAYIWWGLCPGFFLLLLPATAPEILAHRFVWSAVFLLALLAVVRRLGDLRRLRGRAWLQLLAASVFIALNWGTYIWAVTHGHVVDAALGYFINPLVTVALGVVIFRERLNRWQLLALVLAVVAVGILTAEVGDVPYVALILAFSFGFYGLIKKVVDADPRVSVTVETLWALPVALGYMIWLQFTHQAHFVDYGVGARRAAAAGRSGDRDPAAALRCGSAAIADGHVGAAVLPQPRTADGLGRVHRTRSDAARQVARLRADLVRVGGVHR